MDNSSTTKPSEASIKKAKEMMAYIYGNPSSLHRLGFEAKKELDAARKSISDMLSTSADEIYFTPGGTTANMTAILASARARKRDGNKVICSALEHPSVMKNFELLKDFGYDLLIIKPDSQGKIDLDKLYNAVDDKTILVSCMAVNNEIGSIQPIDKIKKLIKDKKSNAYFHCDAVQAFCKIDIKPKKLGIDMMSISAHKIHGIKGAGALYLDNKIHLSPVICGGGQEKGLVSGTEAMPAIAAFGAAVKDVGNLDDNFEHVSMLRLHLLEGLKNLEYVSINSLDDAIPYIVNISVRGVPSQVMLNALSADEIFVSAGSACSKGHRSEVLKAMNLSSERIDSAIRISFSKDNTIEDIDALLKSIDKTARRVRR